MKGMTFPCFKVTVGPEKGKADNYYEDHHHHGYLLTYLFASFIGHLLYKLIVSLSLFFFVLLRIKILFL